MKLFYALGACSLADHIALTEAGVKFEYERVDLRRKITASGAELVSINPKGYVPVLMLDNGEAISENVAILDWIAAENPALGIAGPLGRTRLVEALAYIATEIHKSFHAFFGEGTDEDKRRASVVLDRRMQLLSDQMRGSYLFGERPTVADCYLFVMLVWAEKFHIALPAALTAMRARMLQRSAVKAAMEAEGWVYPAPAAVGKESARTGSA